MSVKAGDLCVITLCNKTIDEKYIKEKFTFIPDSMRFRDEELYSASRRFLKDLGLKGDYVGWSEIENPSPEQLELLFSKAKTEKMRIRGTYELTLGPEYESEWYEIEGMPLSWAAQPTERENYEDGEKTFYLCNIRGYAMPHNITVTSRTLCDFSCFREDVKKAVIENGFTGIEFLWIPDVGRFEARQYYEAFPKAMIPWCYENIYDRLDYDIKASDFELLSENSQIIAKNCNALTFSLPLAVERALLPDCDFAGIYSHLTHNHRLLTRKHCRDFLIEEGFLKPEHFIPVIIVDNITEKEAKPLLKIKSGIFTPVTQKVRDEIEAKYKKHCKKTKPKRITTEKIAVQKLRVAKKENGEYYGKRTSEKILKDVPDERLIPYYKIANGGVLSDEYTFFSVKEAQEETTDFWKEQELENTDIIPEKAVVFAGTADGEHIILFPDGKVVRYQRGERDFAFEWPAPEHFFEEVTE